MAPGDGEELANSYDYFVAGSDQVWNPELRFACPTDFLRFAPAEKRVAYAASFGVDRIEEPWRSVIAPALAEIDAISVREISGAEIVHRLTGRDCPVVLDPTLLIDEFEWHSLADIDGSPRRGGYVASYLLQAGTISNRRSLDASAGRYNLEVRDLLVPNDDVPVGVPEFLNQLRNATLVVTDSFHATVFAILFKRPIVLLSRPGMNGRIETLLRSLGVDLDFVDTVPVELPMDPPSALASERLAQLRLESTAFLKSALA